MVADYILLIQMDIPAELEDDFNHYYNTHLHRGHRPGAATSMVRISDFINVAV